MRFLRPLPILVLLLTFGTIAAVTLLGGHADASRREQLRIDTLTLALRDLQTAAFTADKQIDGTPAAARAEIEADQKTLWRGFSSSDGIEATPATLATARSTLAGVDSAVADVYRIAISPKGVKGSRQIPAVQARLTAQSGRLFSILEGIGAEDSGRARTARLLAALGTGVAMLLLVGVFLFFYLRSRRSREAAERLARENEELLGESQMEASTDLLTGLGNRRGLIAHLEHESAKRGLDRELLMAVFDLDGFKQYNDTFGHAAGDVLLSRLGGRLARALEDVGAAYRMGGDEFCVLARCDPASAETLLAEAVAALSEEGEGWSVGCSFGAVWIPSEAASDTDALRLADRRMYANKASRAPASQQLTDVLLQVLSEQDKCLDEHVTHVSELSCRVAEAMEQPEHEVQRIRTAAALHDIGKAAIPTAILNQPGPLDEEQWGFIHRHTLIGERIALAAPALATAAPLIRSSHEHFDGSGYPDNLAGGEIPLGARIIAVCDAFDAMTSPRPYREQVTTAEALEELRRCAGSQFDPAIVAALADVIHTSSSGSKNAGRTGA
jgi:diguanylate cyclase (GGDEF)-like protein